MRPTDLVGAVLSQFDCAAVPFGFGARRPRAAAGYGAPALTFPSHWITWSSETSTIEYWSLTLHTRVVSGPGLTSVKRGVGSRVPRSSFAAIHSTGTVT